MNGLGHAKKLANKVASSIVNYTIGTKHLMGSGGNYSKFASASQTQIRSWIATSLKSGTNFAFNSSDSYVIIYNMGRVIGTNGEQRIKIAFTFAGRIILGTVLYLHNDIQNSRAITIFLF